jgi:MFS family permease
MAHVPRGLAKRLDRLARRAHRFHRFAHHPLCDRYRGELIAIGRKNRICRGCTLAVLGGVLGGALAALLPVHWLHAGRDGSTLAGFVLLVCALALVAIGLRPARSASAGAEAAERAGMPSAEALSRQRAPRSRDERRPSKLVTRLLPAALFASAAVLGARAASPLGLALCVTLTLVVAHLQVAYRKRGPDRTPCATCEERAANVCRGLAPIVQRERAFVRYSRRLLA